MAIMYFTCQKLQVATNSGGSASVKLNANQDFSVDPNLDPRAADNLPLNLNIPAGDPNALQKARPFFVTSCRGFLAIFRIGTLNFNPIAFDAWSSVFNARRAVVVQMLIENNPPVNLTIETALLLQQPAPALAFVFNSPLQAFAFVPLAIVNFVISVVTLRIFKQRAAPAQIEERDLNNSRSASRT